MPSEAVVLRYFSSRGRAQPIRHALADAGIPFEDLRIQLHDWTTHRADASFSGPFRALPTLSWGTTLVAETLPIATFVARRLGEYDGLSDDEIARREAICSCAYVDVFLRLAELIYADMLYPGADVPRAVAATLPRTLDKVALLDAAVAGAPFIGGAAPCVADHFAGEAFETVCHFMGNDRAEKLVDRFPNLGSLARRLRERPLLADAWVKRPSGFTSRPDELDVLEGLRRGETRGTSL